ncbi:S1C family serine protease [Micromonosporaceae bacterium DT194]|uniref:S1C family serine protease n=1 Tax=Melissospora conviva TaxID=3388432 RepID=UPI003C29745E
MTDGWNQRRPGSAYPPAGPPPPGSYRPGGDASPWWSAEAPRDPWRDPYSPAAVVIDTVPPPGTRDPEPVVDPDAPRPRGTGPYLLISLVTALLAGLIGGALGYTLAVRDGVAGFALGAAPATVPSAVTRPADSLAGVAERVLPSVVTIKVRTSGGGSVGSGFVASSDGYVITNDHVVANASGPLTVTFHDGTSAAGTVVGQEPESDIAVVKVSRTGLAPVEFGDSDALAVGDPVLAFGAPLSLSNTVTAGIISAVDRTIESGERGGQGYYAAIQTDAAVNQGNSGGPLVDAAGRVIGVNTAISSLAADREQAGNIGLAFAVPINQTRRITQDIIATGKARRTVIGAQIGDAGSGEGVRLSRVDGAGPAAGAGLRAGDVVLRFADRPIEEPGDLIALVRKHAPGSVVTVEYRRGAERRTAAVTLAADVN